MANEKLINSRVQLKIDSDYNWAKATTFIPKDGEPIIYRTDNDIVRIKIGDGSTAVNSLPFINTPYQVLPADSHRQLYSIVDEILHHCFNQHALLADQEKLYLVYFQPVSDTQLDPFLNCTCLTNGGHVSVRWTEEVAEELWSDFANRVWQAGLESLCDEWASITNNPMVLCRPYNGSENGYVDHIQETIVQYHTTAGDFPKVTTSNNQSITSEDAFLSHFDTGLSEQVTITDLLNVYSLYYADTCSGMRLGTSKNVGSITISCPYEFEVRYASYFSYNSSTGAIVGRDDSWVSIDGNKQYLGAGATASSTFDGGTHTISTCVDENGTHQGRIIITGFTISSSSGPSAEYTYHELARLKDITAEIDALVENVIAPTQQEINDIRVDDIRQDSAIKELQNTLGTTQIYDVKSSLPKAGPEHLDGKIFQFKDNLYKCIANGEGDNQEYSLVLAGTSEITAAQLTQENSPVYGELGKVFKKNVEISTSLTKVFRNNDSIKLGSSSATGSITFMSLHSLPVNKVTIGLRAYNAKGSSFNIEDDQNNIYYVDIPAGNTDEVLFSMVDDDNSGQLVNFTISSLAEANHDKRGCVTRLIIDCGNVTYEWKNLTATTSQISTTWAELKEWRDNSKLIPGMKYRITDYECRVPCCVETGNSRYVPYDILRAEKHHFDIIVEALSNNTLSEDAQADYHYGVNGEADGYFQYNNFNSDMIEWHYAFRLAPGYDGFDAYGWTSIVSCENNMGELVPTLIIDNRNAESSEYTQYFYEGTYEFENHIYLRWRVIEDNTLDPGVHVHDFYTWDETGGTKYILTNVVNLEDLSAVDLSSIQVQYCVYDDAESGGRYMEDDIKDTFVAGGYKENPNGKIVPVLWKTDLSISPEPDYEDTYYYVGEWEYAGETFDRWDKVESSDPTFPVAGYALTNKIVDNNQFIDNILSTMVASQIPSWKLKYCLDNDITRFNWATNGEVIKILDKNGQIWTRDPSFDHLLYIDLVNPLWSYAYSSMMNENEISVIELDEIDADLIRLGQYQTIATDYIRDSVNGEWVPQHGGGVDCTFSKIWTEVDPNHEGRGVIYHLVDEFNNECDYDFKNITFRPRVEAYQYIKTHALEYYGIEKVPQFFYTLHQLQEVASGYNDASVIPEFVNHDNIPTVYNNKVCAWHGWADETGKTALILPSCVLLSETPVPSVFNNTIAGESYDIVIYGSSHNNIYHCSGMIGTAVHKCTISNSANGTLYRLWDCIIDKSYDLNLEGVQGGNIFGADDITCEFISTKLIVGAGANRISMRDTQPSIQGRIVVVEPGVNAGGWTTLRFDMSVDYDDYRTIVIENKNAHHISV